MKIYLDMDGVLTDFEKEVSKLSSIAEKGLHSSASKEDKKLMYKEIDKAGEEFWANMSWKDGGKKLWNFLKPFNPVLLSDPGLFSNAVNGKKIWVSKNTPGAVLILEMYKFIYAEPEAILIDDRDNNINKWIAKGGIGILYKDCDETIKEIKKIKSVKKVIGNFTNRS